METCPRCSGRGEICTPGWFHVEFYELGDWRPHLDYATLVEAMQYAREQEPQWGAHVRVRRKGLIEWHGKEPTAPEEPR
jgi:hypothetical protein